MLIKARRSLLLASCDVQSNVRRKRQADSDSDSSDDSSDDDGGAGGGDSDDDEYLNKQLITQAVIHATRDIEQVHTYSLTLSFHTSTFSCASVLILFVPLYLFCPLCDFVCLCFVYL